MSRVNDLLVLLRELNVKIWVEGDNLRLKAPANSITPQIREELALYKAEIINFLREANQSVTAGKGMIKPQQWSGKLPLSFAQKRLWFLYQLEPASPTYNVPLAVRLRGEVNLTALENSFSVLIARHEALRTVFPYDDGTAYQQVNPPAPFRIQIVDLQGEPEATWRAWLRTEANRPFDLSQGLLMRVAFLKLAPSEAILFLNLHHIITDEWSTDVLLREVSELYAAQIRGVASSLPPLPIQYADFTLWQREWLRGESLREQMDYWRKQLQGVSTAIELPLDHPRPARQTYRGTMLEFPLPHELMEKFKTFSMQQGVTLFMSLLAVFEVLLYRYSNQTEFTIGTPVANRSQTGVEGLIGFFVNTLVLRAELSADQSFIDLLQRVRETSLGAYTHQDLPFEKLVDDLHVQRDLSRNALFQVMFVLQNASVSSFNLPGMEVHNEFIVTDTSKFDLTFLVNETGSGYSISIEYSTDLFEPATIARLAGHYQCLLGGILADPAQRLSTLPLLTDAERHQVLVEWNATEAAYPQDKCIHEIFEEQAAQTPDAPAVVFEGQTLTYHELNRRANQLAHHLQKLGVGPNVLVGICLERSLDMVIGLYGILKAGGAYVPLDPMYPSERLAFMLGDAGVKVLLTQDGLLSLLSQTPALEANRTRLLCLDCDWSEIALEPTENPVRQVSPADLAYMIYTSGSTGKPKGALNSHAGIFNRLWWMQAAYQLDAADRVLQKTPFSFDVSVWEFFWPLMFGARLIVARPEGHKDPQYLAETIRAQQVTTLHFVPSMLYAFLDAPGTSAQCGSVRRVICSGEALPVDLMNRFFEALPHAELHNLYGPTEAAVDVSYWQCRADAGLTSVPLGRPVANTQLYILDRNLQPLPAGVSGELHIGGVQVGLGYLHREELTAEKFIANPYGAGRLYKTGDLARYLPDGTIEYLGRMDHQVKIRGFRVELGEIEAMLNSHPAIEQAVVVARTENTGHKRLIGYLTTHEDALVSKDELVLVLRSYLKQHLPDYMVPSAFVVLAEFPLSPNGKVDRNAFPEPDTALTSTVDFIPPQNVTEKILAEIWMNLLGLPQVGRNDNFFELGGDSILSIQFISRAQTEGLYLTPRQVFEAQTIAGLAQVAAHSKPIQAEQGLVLGPVNLTPIQHWFFEKKLINPHRYNQSVLMEAEQRVEATLFREALRCLMAHHDALRARFKFIDQHWEQEYADLQAATDLVEQIDLAGLALEKQDRQLQEVNENLQSGLNIQNGPLLRAAIFDYGIGRPQKLLIVLHHLAVDFVSWQILISDLWTVYDQLEHNRIPQLPRKTSSFKAWSGWLSEYARHTELKAEMEYWLEIGDAAIQSLPVDDADQRNNNRVSESGSVDVTLSAKETAALLWEIAGVYHTQINDLLLTALAQTLASWTGKTDILIDVEGHGREAETLDLSRTIGWFTSIYPVHLQLNGQAAGEAIKSVKEQLRRIPRKGMGYGVLRYLKPETAVQLAALPQAEICFNYGGQLKTVTVQGLGGEWGGAEDLGYLFTVNVGVANDQLTTSWVYGKKLYRQETVENLAQAFLSHLRELITHCQSPEAGGYTPSDFPLSGLSQAELDHLLVREKDITDVYSLSPMQAVMLAQCLEVPRSEIYFTQNVFQITGDLDAKRFQQAWQQMVDRHVILRTSFAWQNLAQPVQIVHEKVSLPWEELNWEDVPVAERISRLEKFLEDERCQGFDLAQAPLMRCTLIRLDDDLYQLIWHCHHLLLDGWTYSVLLQEVSRLYVNPTLKLSSPLPYREYIAWLRRQDLEPAKKFWQEHLAGFTVPTVLPVQKRSQPVAGDYYAEESLWLTAELSKSLQAFASQKRLTFSSLFQGAWALTLRQYKPGQDIVFGVTVSGRSASLVDIESRVGLFINTLPLRVKMAPTLNWISWLQQIMQDQANLEQYAYTPPDVLKASCEMPAEDLLFQSNVRFQNYPLPQAAMQLGKGVAITDVLGVDRWRYPINLIIVPDLRVKLLISYNARSVEASVILEILQRMESVLSRFLVEMDDKDLGIFLSD